MMRIEIESRTHAGLVAALLHTVGVVVDMRTNIARGGMNYEWEASTFKVSAEIPELRDLEPLAPLGTGPIDPPKPAKRSRKKKSGEQMDLSADQGGVISGQSVPVPQLGAKQ